MGLAKGFLLCFVVTLAAIPIVAATILLPPIDSSIE